jgi:hypothetical protein
MERRCLQTQPGRYCLCYAAPLLFLGGGNQHGLLGIARELEGRPVLRDDHATTNQRRNRQHSELWGRLGSSARTACGVRQSRARNTHRKPRQFWHFRGQSILGPTGAERVSSHQPPGGRIGSNNPFPLQCLDSLHSHRAPTFNTYFGRTSLPLLEFWNGSYVRSCGHAAPGQAGA